MTECDQVCEGGGFRVTGRMSGADVGQDEILRDKHQIVSSLDPWLQEAQHCDHNCLFVFDSRFPLRAVSHLS